MAKKPKIKVVMPLEDREAMADAVAGQEHGADLGAKMTEDEFIVDEGELSLLSMLLRFTIKYRNEKVMFEGPNAACPVVTRALCGFQAHVNLLLKEMVNA